MKLNRRAFMSGVAASALVGPALVKAAMASPAPIIGKQFLAGESVMITSALDPTQWIVGKTQFYDKGALSVLVTHGDADAIVGGIANFTADDPWHIQTVDSAHVTV